jgi:hypothetical protein
MTKLRKSFDNDHQPSLFDMIVAQAAPTDKKSPGCMNIDTQFREAISEAIKKCPRSRWEIAGRMSELTGHDITKTMLDSWTSEAHEQHRFPAIFVPAFCDAVACSEPLYILGSIAGVFVMPGPEALRAEIRKMDEKIEKQQAERRKRILFLKEMEVPK